MVGTKTDTVKEGRVSIIHKLTRLTPEVNAIVKLGEYNERYTGTIYFESNKIDCLLYRNKFFKIRMNGLRFALYVMADGRADKSYMYHISD